jgi:hypothetical protein
MVVGGVAAGIHPYMYYIQLNFGCELTNIHVSVGF